MKFFGHPRNLIPAKFFIFSRPRNFLSEILNVGIYIVIDAIQEIQDEFDDEWNYIACFIVRKKFFKSKMRLSYFSQIIWDFEYILKVIKLDS